MLIRDITAADVPALLTLNNADEAALPPLTAEVLEGLLRSAPIARMSEGAEGFLIAFDHSSPPQSPHHSWFTARESYFTYIERLAVAPAARRQGVGRALVADLTAISRAEHAPLLVCEARLEPPNDAAMAFLQAGGFAVAGETADNRHGARVRYFRKEI